MRFRLLQLMLFFALVQPIFAQEDSETFRGTLDASAPKLKSGEFYKEYSIQVSEGDYLVVDLYSREFDPYLILIPPKGEQQDNDNHDGSNSRSQVSIRISASGTLKMRVTTSRVGEKGRFLLMVANRSEAVADAGTRTERGSLSSSDTSMSSGEYYDTYTVEGVPGQHLKVTLNASGFDPYLIVKEPGGKQHENDDAGDSKTQSEVELDLTENGTYKIYVTAFKKGETGAYTLTIQTTNSTGLATQSQQEQRDVVLMRYGQSKSGTLEGGDAVSDDGAYEDHYAFEGKTGDTVIIDLSAADFDPYLALILPDGREVTNDDFEGSNRRSLIEMKLTKNGRYRVLATSYVKEEAGSYTLSVRKGTGASTNNGGNVVNNGGSNGGNVRPNTRPGAGTIYGIFMGVSNYGGRMSNLRYTDRDPNLVRDALVRGAGMPAQNGVVLIDNQATLANFKQNLRNMASRITPNDVFVFFYSGHGGRYERDGEQMADPDGRDESLEFYDKEILDDELSQLLDQVNAKTQLIVLDACFSGGFSKDIISKPRRMGMFSSEEDVTSGVASKFQAGGYLSQFFAEALTQPQADEDGDGTISAFELSQYIYERYRGEVKSSDDDDFVFSSRNLGYQKLVVDRGSIRPNDGIFKRR